MKILLTAINAKYIHSNLAVYSLKAYAEKYYEKLYSLKKCEEKPEREQPEIKIREFTINHSIDEILKELYQEQPDVLCFSCYIWNIRSEERRVGKECT